MFLQRLVLHKKRLTSTVVSAAIIPPLLIVVCTFLFALHSVEHVYHKEGAREILACTEHYKERMHLTLKSAVQALTILAGGRGAALSPADLEAYYLRLKQTMAWLEGMAVIDASGHQTVTAGKPRLLPEQILGELFASQSDASGPLITDVRRDSEGIPHFFIILPLTGSDPHQAVYLSVNAFLFSELLDRVRLGRTGEVFLINHNGTLQTRSVLHGAILGEVDAGLAGHISQPDTISTRQWRDTRLWFATLAVDAHPQWRLVVQRDEREILQARNTQIARFLVLGALCLIAFTAIAIQTVKKVRHLFDRMEEEREHLTDYHIQVQKLDAISQLGVGIAHEVNNPLAIIGEEAGWLQDVLKRESFKEHPDAGELRDSLRQIVTQTGRCREITHKLLSFGGKTDGTIRDVDLNTLVADIVMLRRRDASQKHIEIREELAQQLPVIHSEPALLRQLLLNVLNNSMDAMPEGGQITITTRKAGDTGVMLTVHDTGFGIPEENLSRIFEPFFTTKAPGKGAGLGLSICHGILQRIGGRIFVTSQPGQGTTVTVELPPEPRPRAA